MAESRNIYQRLHAAMQMVSYVQKEKKETMQYYTVSHDAVTAKVRPALLEVGVVYHPFSIAWKNTEIQLQRRSGQTQSALRTDVEMKLRFVNVDDPKDFVDVPCVGIGIDEGDKSPGKAVSYAVKYGLLKGLGLETGEDSDNDHDIRIGKKLEVVDPGTGEVKEKPYKDMDAQERVVYWRAEFKRADSKEALSVLGASLSKAEPDGSEVRKAMAAAYSERLKEL